MQEASKMDAQALPTTARLLKATALAIVVAAALLMVFVLPAEYGLDPTGFGTKMGLTNLSVTHEEAPPVQTPSFADVMANALSPLWERQGASRTDSIELTLAPNEGREVKALMQADERFFFHWSVEGGEVSFDMHGEKLGATTEFTSFLIEDGRSTGSGYFAAPFTGTHGWYWKNKGPTAVTVKVTTTGYYEKLYRP